MEDVLDFSKNHGERSPKKYNVDRFKEDGHQSPNREEKNDEITNVSVLDKVTEK